MSEGVERGMPLELDQPAIMPLGDEFDPSEDREQIPRENTRGLRAGYWSAAIIFLASWGWAISEYRIMGAVLGVVPAVVLARVVGYVARDFVGTRDAARRAEEWDRVIRSTRLGNW